MTLMLKERILGSIPPTPEHFIDARGIITFGFICGIIGSVGTFIILYNLKPYPESMSDEEVMKRVKRTVYVVGTVSTIAGTAIGAIASSLP